MELGDYFDEFLERPVGEVVAARFGVDQKLLELLGVIVLLDDFSEEVVLLVLLVVHQ